MSPWYEYCRLHKVDAPPWHPCSFLDPDYIHVSKYNVIGWYMYRTYPFHSKGIKRVAYPSWQGFIPCSGYSDLGCILSLPTEPNRHTFSALQLVNSESSRSSGSAAIWCWRPSQALSCTVQTDFARTEISDPLSPVNSAIWLVGIAQVWYKLKVRPTLWLSL